MRADLGGSAGWWDYRTPDEVADYRARKEVAFEERGPRYRAFLDELTALTREHGVVIYSQGDYCDGFSLRLSGSSGEYVANGNFDDIDWDYE